MPSSLHRYDEPGHVHFLTVSCLRRLPFFGSPEARDLVVTCMDSARNRLAFRWIGFVIMPEHVHWLWYPHPRGSEEIISIASILESLKTSIGMRVKKLLRTKWAQHRTLGHPQLDRWATARSDRKPIWTTRGVDVNVTDYAALRQKLDYCHANPIKRGLVERAGDWAWSSYRFYELDDLSGLRMDWDGSWPIV